MSHCGFSHTLLHDVHEVRSVKWHKSCIAILCFVSFASKPRLLTSTMLLTLVFGSTLSVNCLVATWRRASSPPHLLLVHWQKWRLAAKCCTIQNAVSRPFLQRIVAAPFIRTIKPFHNVALSGRYRAASISRRNLASDWTQSKRRQQFLLLRLLCVCLLSRSFAGINTYIFKLKSAASPGDPAALALLRLSPAHFSGQF